MQYALHHHLPGVGKILRWVRDGKTRFTTVNKPHCFFSNLSNNIIELERSKKHPIILKRLKKVEANVQAYKSKYPMFASYLNDRADEDVKLGFPELNLESLALVVIRLRAEVQRRPELRLRFPFHTHVVEHAEELLPALAPHLNGNF